MSKVKQFILKNWPIIIILILAAFLRLYRIADYMTFLGDEGRDALVVYNILHGKLTLLGPTASVGGFFLGPIYYYFMAVFTFLFNYDPVGPSVMVALFGVATVWLTYKIVKEFFSKNVALITALIYSIAPVVIAYSRSSWNPNLMPFFSLLSAYVLYKAINKRKWYLFAVTGFLLGILIQLHYLALFLIFILFVYLLFANFVVFKEKAEKFLNTAKETLIVLAGFIIGWSPFLAFEVRHGFPNVTSIYGFIFSSGETGAGNNLVFTVYDVFFRLFARLVFAYPPPEQLERLNQTLTTPWQYFILVFAVFSLYIFIRSFIKSFKKGKEELLKYSLLAIWFVLGILLFGFYKKSIYEYYFGFMFPLPFIITSLSLSYLYNKGYLKYLAILIFLFLLFINFQGIPFRYEPNRQLNQARTIAKFVYDKTDNKPYNFALITGGNSDYAYRYFFTVWGRPPVTIEEPAKDPERKSVTDQLLVVCESLPCEPLGHSLWEVAGFGRAEITGEWDVSVVKVYKLNHFKEK